MLRLSTFNPERKTGMGECLLIEIFTSAVSAKYPTSANSKDAISNYSEEWIHAVSSLKDIAIAFNQKIYHSFKPAIKAAFAAEYLDPCNAVEYYVQQLQMWMTEWQHYSSRYNAPYTSVVNASMMGKSRLMKQIAVEIPTLYICLRENDDGYPSQSSASLSTYLTKPPYSSTNSLEANENDVELHLLALFCAMFEILCGWCNEYNPSQENDRKRLRERLWYHLAEDENKPSREKFWDSVVSNAKKSASNNEDEEKIMKKLLASWEMLMPYLFVKSGDPMLLIVWDEARTLVNTAIDGTENEKLLSIFRFTRRTCRKIGCTGGLPTTLRVFSIFTDTSSRLANFQPRGDTDSSRIPIQDAVPTRMFRPINLMPAIDAAAVGLSVTWRPSEVARTSRLIKFGRPAWDLLFKGKPGYDLRDLARSKLLRTSKLGLQLLFSSENRDDVTLKMLACICSRLAIHTGSYVTATKELVASYMMPLERVGQYHDQLETRYLSEPILAEVAAEATGIFGWTRPLETLLSEMRSGVVVKGYRGEFVTKVLLAMAMEDAQKRKKKKGGWPFSQAVPVREFLNSLLRNPYANEDQPPDTSCAMPRTIRKRKLPDGGSDQLRKTKKVQSVNWDDLTSDGDEEISEPDRKTDSIPDGFEEYLASEMLLKGIFGRDSNEKARKSHLHTILEEGYVFFNHFIWAETTIRPSTLVKAWNRCAAIMTKVGAVGIDSIIPVIIPNRLIKGSELGPMFGAWSDKQEQIADAVLAYILIQTKNRIDLSPGGVKACLMNCIPITSQDQNHPIPNFMMHKPSNPFVSILMELGCVREGESRVQIINTVDYSAFQTREVELEKLMSDFKNQQAELNADMLQQTSHQDQSPMVAPKKSKKLVTAETIKKAERILENERDRLRIRERQLPMVAYGLDAGTYKCLEGRGSVVRLLNELLDDKRNPVRGLKDKPVLAALIRMGHHVAMNPARESIFYDRHTSIA